MTIISNTTLIILLIKINRVDFLEKLFGKILILETIYRELTANIVFTNEVKIVKASLFLKRLQFKIKNHWRFYRRSAVWMTEQAKPLFLLAN